MSSAPLFDSHCHIDFEVFDGERPALWGRCQAQGLTGLVVPGVSPAQWPGLEALCAHYDWHYGAGVHPWWVADHPQTDQWLTSLRQVLAQPRCVALGECGLDNTIATPLAQQQAVFEAQVGLAAQLNKPLIIHSVRSHNAVLRTLKQKTPARGGVIHAFSGSPEQARQFWDAGFYLGIGGTITYARAAKTRRAVQQLPLEALLLETDAPDMPLAGRQGQRNSPEYLPEVARVLAELRGQSVREIAEQTTANSCRLFGL
ncbi:TatD family hydrolase [Marinimicrobium alkaliphilum]|uniref:TatD family hydrolase n=1 Tax=Marinimicrobium alkaliphilum TaxID=2202654 RepID=UPI001E5E4371|nr:TatD family hydrolase [Marinimicrobium alkaliphilum]